MTIDHSLTTGVIFSPLLREAWLRSSLSKIVAPLENGKPVDFRIIVGDEAGEYRVIADGVDLFPTIARFNLDGMPELQPQLALLRHSRRGSPPFIGSPSGPQAGVGRYFTK